MTSTQPQAPTSRSNTGTTGRAATFRLPARAESWASSMSKKKKPKTKIARESSYAIDFDEMEDWLVKRFKTLSATQIALKDEDDWFVFNIPEDESISKDDKAAIEELRKG